MVRVIDMHNHLVAPEVVAFLEREGVNYNTRIVERDGQRFFVIQETARRPLHARISQVEARLSDMDAEGVDIQAISCVPFVMYPEVPAAWAIAIARLNNEALMQCYSEIPLFRPPGDDLGISLSEEERTRRLELAREQFERTVLIPQADACREQFRRQARWNGTSLIVAAATSSDPPNLSAVRSYQYPRLRSIRFSIG